VLNRDDLDARLKRTCSPSRARPECLNRWRIVKQPQGLLSSLPIHGFYDGHVFSAAPSHRRSVVTLVSLGLRLRSGSDTATIV
jgi:hypothetical protein